MKLTIQKIIQICGAVLLLIGVSELNGIAASSDKVFYPPPKGILNFTLGYNDFLASLFWVRVTQDLEVCDQNDREIADRSQLDTEGDPIFSVLSQKIGDSRCREGWVFKMVNLVTDLDKKFKAAYRIGGTFLSVLVDDRVGAKKIYDKGVENFPKDWELLYFSASHHLFELKEPKKAASLLVRAGDNGAPIWVYSLAAGLYSRLGRAQFARGLLKSVMARNPKGPLAERLEHRLIEIEKVLAEEQEK